MTQNTSPAVMAGRVEPGNSLDFFPTPPWATRALVLDVLVPRLAPVADATVWEPAAGEGHMAETLREFFARVYASDIHDYGHGYAVEAYVDDPKHPAGAARIAPHRADDWVITNPPFKLATPFVKRAVREAAHGVAMFVRTQFLESAERWALFDRHPPALIAQFAERVPLVKGRWDPGASSASAYCWVIWQPKRTHSRVTEFTWIAPGAKARHMRSCDVKRFCK